MDLSDNAAHILIVDDDQRIRDWLAQYLFENGFRVTTATILNRFVMPAVDDYPSHSE
jgi:DNA-binding response OmpR family regulator